MCCGRSRPVSASPRLRAPGQGSRTLAYGGRTALTVTGPVTGAVYRFSAPGARLSIDVRDVGALLKVPVLRAAD